MNNNGTHKKHRRHPAYRFNLSAALEKINSDLEASGIPRINETHGVMFVERGNFTVCQVRATIPHRGRGRKPAQLPSVVGYGISKYNPKDRKLGLNYSPDMGKKIALSKAVTDMVTIFTGEANGQ